MLNATDRSSRGRPGIEEGAREGGGRRGCDGSFPSMEGKAGASGEGNEGTWKYQV